jgi:predicted nucleotidyltransferase
VNREAEIRKVVAQALSGEEHVAAAYLFGSFARRQATALSDVDLALVVAETCSDLERGRLIRRLLVELGGTAPGTSFDVRLLDELPVAIAGRAVTEGELVFERDAVTRLRTEVATRMAFYDFAWFEQAYVQEGLEGLRRRLDRG